jgi:hypothetical protein
MTMKLEYLPSGAADSPLVRLYAFTTIDAGHFHRAVGALASGEIRRVEVHALPYVESVAGCRLTLCRRDWDQAVTRTSEQAEFECGFTGGTWNNVAGLIQPFTREATGSQWLAESPGEAALLLSSSGQW